MRLIDADKLLESLGDEPEVWYDDGYMQGLLDEYRVAVEAIKSAPTVESVKHL